jgi:allene oxide cyclase
MKLKRFVVAGVIVGAAVLVFAVVGAASGHPKPGRGHGHPHGGAIIHVIEHATTDTVTNPPSPPASDSAGNVLTFNNDVFDAANATKVGSDQGYCVRIVVGKSWECNWTTFLSDGQITVEGPFSDTGDTVVAITGGTGKYRNARGEMELKYHTPTGTEFDFVFHVIG